MARKRTDGFDAEQVLARRDAARNGDVRKAAVGEDDVGSPLVRSGVQAILPDLYSRDQYFFGIF